MLRFLLQNPSGGSACSLLFLCTPLSALICTSLTEIMDQYKCTCCPNGSVQYLESPALLLIKCSLILHQPEIY